MMNNTKRMLGGLLSAAVVLSGCGTSYYEGTIEEDAIYEEEIYDEPMDTGSSTNTDYEPEEEYVAEGELQLDHLQPYYPDLDLEAMETYIEENGLEFNEEELIAFLDDLQNNGETTVFENYYADENVFPWWLFLAASVTKTKPTGKITFNKPSTKTTTTKASSGFGSGSSSSGS
ncbi:hypothetical protein ACFQPF_05290 [Fictibacillus iocasae]|uniref:Uncharacterized protein n=1 Tax=Fictibacillus iocasae TaxID=2715437 RepID=A0ABW2NPG0_9BACL